MKTELPTIRDSFCWEWNHERKKAKKVNFTDISNSKCLYHTHLWPTSLRLSPFIVLLYSLSFLHTPLLFQHFFLCLQGCYIPLHFAAQISLLPYTYCRQSSGHMRLEFDLIGEWIGQIIKAKYHWVLKC